MGVYAGLYRMDCAICGSLEGLTHTVTHKDSSRADICAKCYTTALVYPPFEEGLKKEKIKVQLLQR